MSSSTTASTRTQNGDRVQSVARAGMVLEALMSTDTPMSVLDVSRGTGLNRSITHRLLRTLQDLGMVEEPTPGRFSLGPANLLTGQAYLDRLPVRRLALPYVVDVNNRVVRDRPWVVALAIPVMREAVIVDRLWQTHAPLDSILDVGTRMPFTGSANGRAMLAAFNEDEGRLRIGDEAYDDVADRLQQIRDRDYVEFASGELRPGISAMAAAIRSSDGAPVGTIAVSGLNLDAELVPDSEVAMHVRRTAHAIASVLPRVDPRRPGVGR